jgi:hypothetical protein
MCCDAADVQTAALLSCYMFGGTGTGLDARRVRMVTRWIAAYVILHVCRRLHDRLVPPWKHSRCAGCHPVNAASGTETCSTSGKSGTHGPSSMCCAPRLCIAGKSCNGLPIPPLPLPRYRRRMRKWQPGLAVLPLRPLSLPSATAASCALTTPTGRAFAHPLLPVLLPWAPTCVVMCVHLSCSHIHTGL